MEGVGEEGGACKRMGWRDTDADERRSGPAVSAQQSSPLYHVFGSQFRSV